MIISIFPRKDTTLYSAAVSESVNTGIDEILEITKIISSSGTTQVTNTRILVDFDLDWISSSIQSGEISRSTATPMDFYLNLFATEAKNIPIEYHLAIAPVSESWDMGVGRSTNNPYVKEGASWKYRDGENTATRWNGNLDGCTTGSTFHSGSFVTKSYQETDDVRASVSKSVSILFDGAKWLPGNQGFLVGRDPIEENDSKRYGSLLYFSNETKTIYKPKLEVCWDDSVFSTGTMDPLDVQNKDITLYVDNNRGTYYSGSRSRFRVRGVEKYKAKTYGTSSQALVVEYLPSSSYYSLVDSKTQETVIPFDTKYTRVSCDSDGNFLDLWMEGLYPERLYELRFKIVSGSSINYYEPNQPFKIIK